MSKKGIDFVVCRICNKKQKQITHAHLKKHNVTFNEYVKMYPDEPIISKKLKKTMVENQIKVQYNNEKNACRKYGKSIKCAGSSKRKILVSSFCEYCKKEFNQPISDTRRFCSRECYDKYRLDNKIKKDWHLRTLERYDFKCALCRGFSSIKVHHIDKNNKNNVDENLIVLCESCHRKVHNGLNMTVYKTFSIEISHNLPNHPTCGFLHGHTVDITVGVNGSVNLYTGMVIDFKDLKRILKDLIIDKFDHSYLNDVFPRPTAELFAFYIFKKLQEVGINVKVVRVHETRDNFAEYKI